MGHYDSYDWRPYVSVAERRRKAEREIRKAASKGVLSKTQASRRVSRLAHSLAAKS